MTGIYVITNKINGKKYVGQSVNISRRWKEHRSRYQIEDGYLYKAMRKYGLDAFTFEILTECNKTDLNVLEQHWIKVYQSNNPNFGYNLTAGGDAPVEANFKISDEEVLQIYDLLRSGAMQIEIANKFGISQSEVSRLNTGETRAQRGFVYPIFTEKRKEYYCQDCGTTISYKAVRCRKCEGSKRACAAIESENRPTREELKNLIRTQSFVAIGKQYGVSDNAVRKWCDYHNLPRRSSDIKKMSDLEWSQI